MKRPMAGQHLKFEHSDVDVRLLAALAVGVAVFLLAAPFVLTALYPRSVSAPGVTADVPLPPQPRLQTAPGHDLTGLRQAEDETLTRYGWVDRKAGVVRLPVARAMELVAQRGVPGWKDDKPAAPIPPRAAQP